MKRWVAVLVAASLVTLLPGTATTVTAATPSPSPRSSPRSSPSPTPRATPKATHRPRSTPRPAPKQTPSAKQARAARAAANRRLIEEARREIGGEVADSLSSIQELSQALGDNAGEQEQLESQVEASQAQMGSLDREIQQRDADMADTQLRIDGERADIAILARELYQQPSSLPLRLVMARSLRDAFTQAGDMTVAALRADTLKQNLSDDLDRLQQDQSDRQGARDQQTQAQAELAAALGQLRDLERQELETATRLQAAIHKGRSALAKVSRKKVKASVAQRVASMLEQQDQELIATTEQQVWQQAQLAASLSGEDPPESPPAGARGRTQGDEQLAWPIEGAAMTQGFGPTSLSLEPAMFGFDHFHSGLDLASPDTAVTAAGDGVVAAVGSGPSGYGTYVIVDHGRGLLTLYGHMAVVSVRSGQRVSRGQPIGVEGSTGASTGVHLHFEVRLGGTPVDPRPYLTG